MDIEHLKSRNNLSLKDLADLVHVSRETIYKYENGIVRANSQTAMLLEDILNMKITIDIDLFEVPKDSDESNHIVDDDKTKDLANLGFGVVQTKKTPFDALAKLNNTTTSNKDNLSGIKSYDESPLIASLEKNRTSKTLQKIAISLKDLSLVTESDPFFIINNEKINYSLDGIPVIKSWELKETEDSTEFLKIIKERKS
jgi:putative transcriptional regulator